MLELSQLDANEFAVQVLKSEGETGDCGLATLQCRLRRAPAEPPLTLLLPSEYPAASPLLIKERTIANGANAAGATADEATRDAFADRVLTLPALHTLTDLLLLWRRSTCLQR